jgi:hypothetical protein
MTGKEKMYFKFRFDYIVRYIFFGHRSIIIFIGGSSDLGTYQPLSGKNLKIDGICFVNASGSNPHLIEPKM